ncbi:MAG: DUF1893 domain-containing protein [Bacillota bacterium]
MNQLDLAKDKLINDNLTLCIVRNGKVFYKTKNRGIYPIYKLAIDKKIDLKESFIADKVVGKAAAMFYVFLNAKNIYIDVLSKKAYEILKNNDINVVYNKKVDYIMNREKNGLCPVEKLSQDIEKDNYKKLIKEVEKFLKKVKVI